MNHEEFQLLIDKKTAVWEVILNKTGYMICELI